MRLRIGVVLCLFAVIAGAGCRKPLTPVVDTDLAPETWITAAPMDSITLRDPTGKPIPTDKNPRKIPIRFHLYWAGSDPDGVVSGFYWAVTETTASSDPTIPMPPLPGPKPQDYHFTNRTDTTFIFDVQTDHPDREHAFFIYAVDNKGKADPTPARFYFTAFDHFQPTPIFLQARAVGSTVPYAPHQTVFAIPDTVNFTDVNDIQTFARDTVAANSRLDFAWTANIVVAGNGVQKYCYKLDEPDLTCGDSTTHSVSYNTGLPGSPPVSVGTKVFHLQVVDVAGGGSDSTRRVYMNYAPDSWFWGPNPNDPIFTQTREGSTGDIHYIEAHNLDLTTWPGVPGSGLSPDSFTVMPVDRPERRTFFEIWNNRIYAHEEGDTVHINSWGVFFSGGYDKDSKYRVKVDPNDPELPDTSLTPVLNPRPENGSPIGFTTQIAIQKDPFKSILPFTSSGLAPVFAPGLATWNPQIGAYWPLYISGRCFAITRSVDGDNLLDSSVPGIPSDLVLHVENGTATEKERVYRRKVISFYVNKAPYFLTCDPGFIPTCTDASCTNCPNPGPYAFHGKQWQLNLLANDVDPYDPNERGSVGYGQPTPDKVFRYKISLLGNDLAGNQRTWIYYESGTVNGSPYFFNRFDTNLDLSKVLTRIEGGSSSAADSLQTGSATLRVELCDCRECELKEGEGVCIQRDFPVTYSPTLEAASSERRGLPR